MYSKNRRLASEISLFEVRISEVYQFWIHGCWLQLQVNRGVNKGLGVAGVIDIARMGQELTRETFVREQQERVKLHLSHMAQHLKREGVFYANGQVTLWNHGLKAGRMLILIFLKCLLNLLG